MEAAMKRKNEAGSALLLVTLGLGVLIGIMGLAVDVGVLRYEKRLQQTAADAAAIVGATNLANGSGMSTGAQNTAAANGYTDASSDTVSACAGSSATVGLVCVQVNNGPSYLGTADPHYNDKKYVEVVVSTVQPTYFMRIFGVNQQTVTARAVATNLNGSGPGGKCFDTLGLPAKEIGVDINGNPTVNAPTCGIADNGNFNTKGNALNVSAGTFAVSGTDVKSGPGGTVTCQYQSSSNCPSYGAPTIGDPLAGLPTPCSLGYTCSGGGAWAPGDGPGTYSSISIGSGSTVNFPAGIYIIDGAGGFSCNGSPTITGTGVMFYFTGSATINCNGNANVNLTAPTASNCPSCPSQLDGVLMYQDPNDTSTGVGNACPPGSSVGPSLGGNAGSSYNGILYFPADQLWLFGNSGTIAFDVVIMDSTCLSGNATYNMQGAAALPTTVSALTNAVLVE
jgi:Flp pilus assembly protein TadG